MRVNIEEKAKKIINNLVKEVGKEIIFFNRRKWDGLKKHAIEKSDSALYNVMNLLEGFSENYMKEEK